MTPQYSVILSMAVGFGLGAVAVHGLHAQAKPPVYYINEIDVMNSEAYLKEYVPKVQSLNTAFGGRYLVSGGKVTPIEGEPAKRISVSVWDSVEKIQAWYNSAELKELRKIGDKYAKFRSYAVEGISQ
jgi:uncharacterized protein (DUF1330 family)